MSSQNTGFTSTQKWTLLSTIMASSLVFIDSTALNVALPALQEDLGITGTELLWVINGYALFLSALLLVGGSLGDLYGRNKIFLIGLGIFSVSSLACGISQSSIQLILARGVQGIGGALLTPGSLSILSSQFPTESRGKAIGIWSTFSALTGVAGPVIGGWLSGMGLWRVIFFINVPLSILVFVSMIMKVPESKNDNAKALDVWGAILVTLGLAGLTYGFIESPKYGFDNPMILAALIIGILALVLFIWVQRNSSHPMMPLKLFSSSNFSGSNLLTLSIYGALGGSMFFLPLNLIQIQGYSELNTGLAMLPIIICISAISPFMGNFVDRNGVRIPLIIGPIITGTGFFIFSTIGITLGFEEYWQTFFIAFTLLGIGMGITVAPLTTAVMGAVSQGDTGIASGVNNTVARTAGVLAIALMGAMVLFSFKSTIIKSVESLSISSTLKDEIIAGSANLAAMEIPEELSMENKTIIVKVIKRAFVDAFNEAAYVASALSWLGAFVAFMFIRNKNEKKTNT